MQAPTANATTYPQAQPTKPPINPPRGPPSSVPITAPTTIDNKKEALLCNAAAVILSHNHPSGNPEPSHEDISLTKKLLSALQLVGIRLLDHMIVGHNEIVSMQSLDLF